VSKINIEIFSTFAVILIIMAIGYLIKQIGWVSTDNIKGFNTIVMNIALPCLMFNSLYTFDLSMISTLGTIPIIGVCCGILMAIITFLIFNLLKIDETKKWSLLTAVVIGNTGFIGFPVIMGIFGETGFLRAVFFNLADNLMFVIIYTLLIVKFNGEYRKIINKILHMPFIWGILIGLTFNIFNIPIGDVLSTTISYLGDITIPLILLTIGLSMQFDKIKEDLNLSLLATALKLFIYPIIALIILSIIPMNTFENNIILIQGGMPAAMVTLSLAIEFDLDTNLATNTIVISTLLSLITLPILISIL